MLFTKLEDSPMFRKQVGGLEDAAETLKERTLALSKACGKFTEYLGEAVEAEVAFVQSVEEFCGSHEDPLAVAVGGTIMAQFTSALRELATLKEALRTQVEHFLTDKVTQFAENDLQHLKEVRKRFDKATKHYDQTRERVLSLRKGSKPDVVVAAEEDLLTAKIQAEQTRFNLMTALSSVESKKKYLYLESVGSIMEAQLRFFKQSYELLSTMEPYVQQVMSFAQQAHEQGNQEQAELAERMYEHRQQQEKCSSAPSSASPAADGSAHPASASAASSTSSASSASAAAPGRGPFQSAGSHLIVSRIMKDTPQHKVQIIKQGYLVKRAEDSTFAQNLRHYFVLDSRGALYYHKSAHSMFNKSKSAFSLFGFLGKKEKSGGSGSSSSYYTSLVSGPAIGNLVGQDSEEEEDEEERFEIEALDMPPPLPSAGSSSGGVDDGRGGVYEVVNLLTATIKVDADEANLRFCFRIVSPDKSFTLQAESEAERLDWMEKITAVIASLLNAQMTSRASSRPSTGSVGAGGEEELMTPRSREAPLDRLRKVEGNDACADCGRHNPDWVSLNLCILMCIECSGAHRNLGVHLSKVRSLTLDVQVWTPSMVALLAAIGNAYANSVWEAVPPASVESATRLGTSGSARQSGEEEGGLAGDRRGGVGEGGVDGGGDSGGDDEEGFEVLKEYEKPGPGDPLALKERFIFAKYVQHRFAEKAKELEQGPDHVADVMRQIVASGDVRTAFRLLVAAGVEVNRRYPSSSTFADFSSASLSSPPEERRSGGGEEQSQDCTPEAGRSSRPSGSATGEAEGEGEGAGAGQGQQQKTNSRGNGPGPAGAGSGPGPVEGSRRGKGSTLLHMACRQGCEAMVELLLLWGAVADARDEDGLRPYDVALWEGHDACAKLVKERGGAEDGSAH